VPGQFRNFLAAWSHLLDGTIRLEKWAASSRQPPFHQEVLTPFVDCWLILENNRGTGQIT
jgi:hypothetical protein